MHAVMNAPAPRATAGTLPVEALVAGRYELCAPLANGGMGAVFRGWDRRLCRPVAVKVVPLYGASDRYPRRTSDHWLWEARMMAAVQHPHVVSVYDAIEDGEHGYVITELVEGNDLKRYAARAGPLSFGEALSIGIQVCRALHALHTRGLIHCDIKPHNILRMPTGWVKLADFGIAQAAGPCRQSAGSPAGPRSGGSLLLPGMLVGTATYCSPEQARNEPLTMATDFYSLGVVLYELLAGAPPFVGETPLALATLHAVAPVPELHHLRPDVPPLVEQAVMRALTKDPTRRFASARAMRAFLEYARSATLDGNAGYPMRAPAAVSPHSRVRSARPRGPRPTACAIAAEPRREGSASHDEVEQQSGGRMRMPPYRTQQGSGRFGQVPKSIGERPIAAVALRVPWSDFEDAAQDGREWESEDDRAGPTNAFPPPTWRAALNRALDALTVVLCAANAAVLLLLLILVSWQR